MIMMNKVKRIYLIFMVIYQLLSLTTSVPLAILNAESNPVIEEIIEDDDDSTTHTLERLSSAATCLVAGIEYTHGQQIYRKDPCEFCLCLDGEMFCWWQDCPPTLEGPCKERGPFSPCLNGGMKSSSTMEQIKLPTTNKPSTIRTNLNNNNNKETSVLPETSSQQSFSLSINGEATETTSIEFDENETPGDLSSTTTTTTTMSTTSTASTTITPKVCIVMGREYQIGDHLPHDTGNCVECICGTDAQINCSPHQCAPLDEDIVYRPPGPRQPIPDVF